MAFDSAAKQRRAPRAIGLFVGLAAFGPMAVSADEVVVMTSGAFTAPFQDAAPWFERRTGHDVVAVEPLPEMLAHVRRVSPSARALEGSAENIPLDDESVDAVTAAQAFHWFDHEVALLTEESARTGASRSELIGRAIRNQYGADTPAPSSASTARCM